jgi:hypothetical protein
MHLGESGRVYTLLIKPTLKSVKVGVFGISKWLNANATNATNGTNILN